MSRNPDQPSTDGPALRFEHVSMRYGRSGDVLKDVTFEVPAGSFHFITGASGAGKSSLLKLIYLAERPSAGRIEMLGKDIGRMGAAERMRLRRRIGVVFQELRLLEHLTAFDNAALPLRIAGHKPQQYRSDVAELLAWVGLKDRMGALPSELSGGEKQRLAIARAVVARPHILLADEPTGNVDNEAAMRIVRLFTELNRLGTTVLVASHDEELVARAGQPVLHLHDGHLIPFGGSGA
ncbi:MAG TPA: cell division ATP-binding protein FtsE [Caulobacteraceae bacterium]|nr:cell division ATP-binding protein FtsE [Caulobacteraceae bacterium]